VRLCRPLGLSLLALSACAHRVPLGVSRAAAAMRAERARFNAAIVGRDTAAIAALLLPTYHIVNGRSAQRHGRADALDQWVAAFRDTTVGYVRTTRTVYVNDAWGLAEELGDWTGHVTAADGPSRSSGVYAAKWQRDTGGRWRLQVEIFTTLACNGGPLGCPRPEPAAP
jgi:ketosteroid isomerase-like protein